MAAFDPSREQHKLYKAMSPLWRFWLQSYRGGEYMRAASIASMQTPNQIIRTAAGAGSELSWSYLWSHKRELTDDYRERVVRSRYLRYAGFAVDVLASGVVEGASAPTETSIPPEWFLDMDLRGTNYNTFIRDLAIWSLVYGHVHVVGDRSLDMPARPYVYALAPLDLISWAKDDRGRFRWAIQREPIRDDSRPPWARSGAQSPVVDELSSIERAMGPNAFGYRAWTPDEIIVFTPDERGEWKEERQPNPLGRVPIVTIYHSKEPVTKEPVGCSWLEGPALSNLHHYNLLSLRDVILTNTAFPFLAVGVPEGQQTVSPDMEMQIGTDVAVPYDTRSGPPRWVEPSTASIDALSKMIREDIDDIREMAGIGRAMEDNGQQHSAQALALMRAGLDARLGAHARMLKEGVTEVLKMVVELGGLTALPQNFEVPFTQDFGAQETGTKLDDLLKALDVGLREVPTAKAELQKAALRVVAPSATNIESIEKDIDTKAKEPPPVLEKPLDAPTDSGSTFPA